MLQDVKVSGSGYILTDDLQILSEENAAHQSRFYHYQISDPKNITLQDVFNQFHRLAPKSYLYDPQLYSTRTFCGQLVRKSPWWIEEVEDICFLNQGHFDWWMHLFENIEKPTSIEHSIYTHYDIVDRVQAIYVQNLPEVYNVFMFLNQDHYEDDLIDRLLDQEAKILDLYPSILFHFHYFPLLKNNESHLVPKGAVLILIR